MIEHTYHNNTYVFVQHNGTEYSYHREREAVLGEEPPDVVRAEMEDYVQSRLN